jgi:hypothetical protein
MLVVLLVQVFESLCVYTLLRQAVSFDVYS